MNQPRSRWPVLGIALLLAGAWGSSVLVQVAVDREMAPYRDQPETLWIPSGKALKTLSLGHYSLLADIYWTRVVQYYGSRLRDHKTDFSLLAPLLDITVTLDPQLMVAYNFGAVFLAAPPPRGAGDPRKAIELLQRGIAANPDEWRLWHHLGFIYYWDLQDYQKAAESYQQGARNPKARPWMKVMAAVILEKGGSRDTSLFLWTEILNGTDDPTIRKNAQGHITGLRAQNDMDEIAKRARLFRNQTGRWPASVNELVSSGLLPGIPIDPAGFPYRLEPEGQVSLDPKSTVQLDYDRSPTPEKFELP